MNFAGTVLHQTDEYGHVCTWQAGDVVTGGLEAWSNAIILGFSSEDEYGHVYVKLARPYAYASCIGTTGPTVMTGTEVYNASVTTLEDRKVVSSRPMVSGSMGSPIERGYDDEIIRQTINKMK